MLWHWTSQASKVGELVEKVWQEFPGQMTVWSRQPVKANKLANLSTFLFIMAYRQLTSGTDVGFYLWVTAAR